MSIHRNNTTSVKWFLTHSCNLRSLGRAYTDNPIIAGGLQKHIKRALKEREYIPHTYKPVIFVMAHSDIDKNKMDQAIDRYNNPLNAEGQNIMILKPYKISL